jgi:hypothetical protein
MHVASSVLHQHMGPISPYASMTQLFGTLSISELVVWLASQYSTEVLSSFQSSS